MSDIKVYVESWDTLYEVHDPIYQADGTVRSFKWRPVGEDRFLTIPGTFSEPKVYEDLFALALVAFGEEPCCGDPENCDQQDTETCTCAQTDGAACSNCPPSEDFCCGGDEPCVDCPDVPQAVDTEVHIPANALLTIALGTLLEIASDDTKQYATATRVDAASSLAGAALRLLGV